MTAPVVFGRLHVLPVVTGFLAQFPEINVRLLLSDRNVHLIDDHIDVAVRIGALPDSILVATRVGTLRRVVCASPDFLAAHGEPKTPAALSDLPCITFDALGSAESLELCHPRLDSDADRAGPFATIGEHGRGSDRRGGRRA